MRLPAKIALAMIGGILLGVIGGVGCSMVQVSADSDASTLKSFNGNPPEVYIDPDTHIHYLIFVNSMGQMTVTPRLDTEPYPSRIGVVTGGN